ncbi:MAG TPA: pilin [Candidatus Paceibacterota bacterium]|nr:pilin [Candidatus Paceibacterota bacterium]
MIKYLATFSLAFVLFAGALPAYAADATFFGPIVPPECNCEEVAAPGGITIPSAPNWGCVMQVVQNSINFAISLSVIIATLYIIYTGFLFVVSAGNPTQREAAKTRLMNVIVGMVVLLSAWLIVDFIMKKLYGEEGAFGPWNAILSGDGELCLQVTESPTPFNTVPGIVPGTGNTEIVNSGGLTHAAAAARLQAAGISVVSTGNCSDKTRANCTSLDGIRSNTVDQAIAVKQACDCDVVVTGGTEAGHASGPTSHANGYKIDLRTTSGVNQYIQSLTPAGERDGVRYLDRCGNEYVREGSPAHWDITVTKGVCSPPKN